MSNSRKKVLWVDDEIEFLRSHIMFLETRGYSITPVFNGDDAIHMLRKETDAFDIVLLDEQMPGKDGLTTLVEIKEIAPDLPVVMVTKSEEEQLMEQAIGKKIDGYLTKPVNPSQILLVCKRLLHSKELVKTQLKQDFVRNYSQNRSILQEKLSCSDWVKLYKNLVKWDLELSDTMDEGIRQAHIGQKSDANTLFSTFIEEHYMLWLRSDAKPPVLSPRVLGHYVIPRLKSGEKVFLVLIDSMRMDQYAVLFQILKNYFSIEGYSFFSILPSAPEFSRSSLLSGLYPRDIAQKYPDIWSAIINQKPNKDVYESQLLKNHLTSCGVECQSDYITIVDDRDAQSMLENIDLWWNKDFVTLVVEFVSLFIRGQINSSILQDMAPDETAFRRLIASWFENSTLFQIFQKLAEDSRTIILTSSSGTVLCTRPTEYYGSDSTKKNLRYQYGDNVTCDERYAYYMHEPSRFNLPQETPFTNYIALKENYYFVNHDSYHNYNEQYQNVFHCGGISMEEIIVPLAILKPKQDGTY